VNTEVRLARAFSLYSKRWDIENYGFREFKNHWGLEALPGKRFAAVCMYSLSL